MIRQDTGVGEEPSGSSFCRALLLLCFVLSGCSNDTAQLLELAALPGITLPGSAVVIGGITHDSSFVFWDEIALYDSDGTALCRTGEILAAASEGGRLHFITASGVVGEVLAGSDRCETRDAGLTAELPILAASWGA